MSQFNLQYMLPHLIELRLELLDRLLISAIPVSLRIEILSSCRQQAINRVDALAGTPTDDQIREILQQLDPPEEVLRQVGVSTLPDFGQPSIARSRSAFAPLFHRKVIGSALWGLGASSVSLLALFGLPLFYILFSFLAAYGSASIASQTAFLTMGFIYLSLIIVSGLVGLVFSLLALYRIRASKGAYSGYRISTAGILVGLFPAAASSLILLYVIMQM